MRKLFVLVSLVFLSLSCYAQSNNKALLSLDFSYSLTSFLSHGWGIGLNYERSLFDYLSLKGNFGHMTLTTDIDDVYCTSVHISVFANYYPLGGNLDKLYIGIGSGCDFMNYFGGGDLPLTTKDTLIHIKPHLGWKFNISKIFMIDVSTGYKFLISETQNYENIRDYVNAGLNFGFGFKILFNQIKKEKQDEQVN